LPLQARACSSSSAATRAASSTAATTTTAAKHTSQAAAPDPNNAALLKYRHAANQLLEKVRSQIASNSKKISSINADITPVHKIFLDMNEAGGARDQTKSAAELSLEDYKELYRTTVFGTMMYVVGAGVILYLLYKPRIQSEF
jgi:hypothetical protein